MNSAQIVEELAGRLSEDRDFFSGVLPERNAIAWRGYLAGLLEWNVIDVAGHDQLLAMLPNIDDDPVEAILLGRSLA